MIRPEQPGDEEAIATLVEAAFGSRSEARFVADVRAAPQFIPDLSLVAEVDGEIVGHVMISYAELRRPDAVIPVASLAPLAVAPSFQGQGIGSALVRAAVAAAEAQGEPMVVVQGDPRYYRRFGFEWSAPHGIEMQLPDWAPPEAAQVLRLHGYDPTWRGRVVYPVAFDDGGGP